MPPTSNLTDTDARPGLRRPLLGLAVFALAGAAAGPFLYGHDRALLFITGACLLAGFLTRARRAGTVWTLAAVLMLFAARSSLKEDIRKELDLMVTADRTFVSIVGSVKDEPELLRIDRAGKRVWAFPLRVEAAQRVGPWHFARADLRALWAIEGDAVPAAYGQVWRMAGLVLRDANARGAPAYTFRVLPDRSELLRADGGSLLRKWCLIGRQHCSEILGRGVEDFADEVGLLRALMLGYRQSLPDSLYNVFSRTGTLHIVAISGSHIVIFSGIVIALLRGLGMPRTRWLYLLAPLLIAYTLGTGMSPSALRACVMAIAFWSAIPFRRRPDGPTSLAAAALVLVFIDPEQLADPGFQLSFIAVAGLMMFYPILHRALNRRGEEDPLALPDTTPRARARRTVRRFCVALAASSLAAWLSTTPLSALLFNQFNPVGLLANLFVIPLASIILFTACLSLLLGVVPGPWAEIFNHANVLFVAAMERTVELFDRLPFGHFFIAAPSWPWIVASYAVMVLIFYGSRNWRRAGLAGVVLALLLGVTLYARDVRVRIRCLGAGESGVAFVDVPGGGDVLVDTGSHYRSRALLQWLRSQGVDGLRAVALTRLKADSAGGLLDLLDRMPVREIWLPEFKGRSPLQEKIIASAGEKGIPVRRLARGAAGRWAGRVDWEILNPAADESYNNSADAGVVLRVSRGPASALLLGELTDRLQASLKNSGQNLAAPVTWCAVTPPPAQSLSAAGDTTLLACDEDEEILIQFADERSWNWTKPAVTRRLTNRNDL